MLNKGVHIDKLREVVNSIVLVDKDVDSARTSDADVVSEELAEDVKYSSAESLAITLAVNELSDTGFFVHQEDVEILDDLLENHFYITDVALDEFPHILSFEFDNTEDRLSKVVVTATVEDGEETTTKKLHLEGDFGTENLLENLTEVVDSLLEEGSSEPEKIKVKVKR